MVTTGAFQLDGRNTDMSVVGDILAEPQAVILYEREDTNAVRDVMHALVAEMAETISVADPLLSSLVVIDTKSEFENWPAWLDVTAPSDVDELTLHPSQTAIILSPASIPRRLFAGRLPTRLYIATPDLRLAEAINIETILTLEHAA